MISIEGLDKAEVLAALYNSSRPQGLGRIHYTPGDMTRSEAAALLEKSTDFDYLKGRVMKVDLKGKMFDPRLYDRDLGSGAADAVVKKLRAKTL